MMKSLKWQLSYTVGFMQLGMFEAAEEELLQIDDLFQETDEVLAIKVELYHQSQNWDKLFTTAETLIAQNPENPGGWVSAAFALRRLKGLEAARDKLIEAVQKHPEEGTIHFNLGCYASQLGQFNVAEYHVRKAIQIEPSFKKIAREDEDLKPLRDTGLNFV